ncbi:hypothetical protein D3C87_1723980 [compost metagenome]
MSKNAFHDIFKFEVRTKIFLVESVFLFFQFLRIVSKVPRLDIREAVDLFSKVSHFVQIALTGVF